MSAIVFDYHNYKEYLYSSITQSPQKGRGLRLKIAEHLNCQPAFISQVLNGAPHFSLEQGVRLSDFLKHTKAEARYFLLLLQSQRAGSEELRNFFQTEIDEILKNRTEVKNRIDIKKSLDLKDQQTYYSSWIYSAVHMLIVTEGYCELETLIDRLKVSREKMVEVLDFLVKAGLAKERNQRYEIGVTRLHIGKESPLLQKHHMNWRFRAITSIEDQSQGNLHYSNVTTISLKDAPVIREIFLKAIEEARAVIKDSPEEDTFCLCLDFFRI